MSNSVVPLDCYSLWANIENCVDMRGEVLRHLDELDLALLSFTSKSNRTVFAKSYSNFKIFTKAFEIGYPTVFEEVRAESWNYSPVVPLTSTTIFDLLLSRFPSPRFSPLLKDFFDNFDIITDILADFIRMDPFRILKEMPRRLALKGSSLGFAIKDLSVFDAAVDCLRSSYYGNIKEFSEKERIIKNLGAKRLISPSLASVKASIPLAAVWGGSVRMVAHLAAQHHDFGSFLYETQPICDAYRCNNIEIVQLLLSLGTPKRNLGFVVQDAIPAPVSAELVAMVFANDEPPIENIGKIKLLSAALKSNSKEFTEAVADYFGFDRSDPFEYIRSDSGLAELNYWSSGELFYSLIKKERLLKDKEYLFQEEVFEKLIRVPFRQSNSTANYFWLSNCLPKILKESPDTEAFDEILCFLKTVDKLDYNNFVKSILSSYRCPLLARLCEAEPRLKDALVIVASSNHSQSGRTRSNIEYKSLQTFKFLLLKYRASFTDDWLLRFARASTSLFPPRSESHSWSPLDILPSDERDKFDKLLKRFKQIIQ